MRKLRTLVVSAAAAGSIAGGVLVATPSVATGPAAAPAGGAGTVAVTVSSIQWKPCIGGTLQQVGALCGTLQVPLDYSRPSGDKVTLALSKLKHTVPDSQYQGIMLVNPGGPGGSGLIYSVLGHDSYVPNGAGRAYDWIGFDPRGVGSSTPALTCIADYFAGPRPEYVPTTAALEKTWLARSKAYARACGKNGGALLDNMRTTDVAKDLDRIREAEGQQKVNFYGFSYGTYLAQVYATQFPSRVRRFVLDSNVDPTRVFYRANLDQDVAFQRNMEIWWAWVAKYDSVYHLGKTAKIVEKNWYAQKEKLRKAPIGGVVGPNEWTDIFLGAGYYQVVWTELASVWADVVNTGDAASVQAVIGAYESAGSPEDDNGFAVYNAVQCTDAIWPKSWDTWKRDNWRTHAKAPFQTWGNAWFNAPCLFWPGKAEKAVDVGSSRVPGMLLISETLDAATPFTGSLEVRKRFPASSLIAQPGGTSHATSLYGNACVDNQIAAYLTDGTLPKRKAGNRADSTCNPLQVPVPQAARASAAPAGGATTLRGAPGTGPALERFRLLHPGRR
jgi:pimeloyl-ACP methyl ester carboxylesterase